MDEVFNICWMRFYTFVDAVLLYLLDAVLLYFWMSFIVFDKMHKKAEKAHKDASL